MVVVRSSSIALLTCLIWEAHCRHLCCSRRLAEEAASPRLREATADDGVTGGTGTGTCSSRPTGDEGVITTSVFLPRAVAPDIAPVILAFLYTDRLDPSPDNGPAGFAEEYLDPELGDPELGESRTSVAAPAMATGSCRPRGRSGFVGDLREVGSSNGAVKIMEMSTDLAAGSPSKVSVGC